MSQIKNTVQIAVGAMATTQEALPRPDNMVGELRQKENRPICYA